MRRSRVISFLCLLGALGKGCHPERSGAESRDLRISLCFPVNLVQRSFGCAQDDSIFRKTLQLYPITFAVRSWPHPTEGAVSFRFSEKTNHTSYFAVSISPRLTASMYYLLNCSLFLTKSISASKLEMKRFFFLLPVPNVLGSPVKRSETSFLLPHHEDTIFGH